jgi:two-component system nitrogen regulation response regulator NtrX
MSVMTVLIVDDEQNLRESIAATFRIEGHRVEMAEGGIQALEAVERGSFDLIMLDLQMPGMDGLEVLRQLRQQGYGLPVIFLTAHGSIEKAVEAVRLGAFDFIEKPPHSGQILLSARNALHQANLEEENRELREESVAHYDMVGESGPMLALFEAIRRTAPTQARVLILGENGTGKELIAHALHRHSARSSAPFVSVNCAAIPTDLFESELFGHERGAFTGATARRRGKFVRAHGGTLFLDEVGEIPLNLQSKLLRALESGEVEPVGSEREISVDVRVISATNKDLERAVEAGQFRRDLYYRINVVTLEAPPLRDHQDDIPAMVDHFLEGIRRGNNLAEKNINADAMRLLSDYDYPGNVRELRNLIERLMILTPGMEIDAAAVMNCLPTANPAVMAELPERGPLRERMAAVERRMVLDTIERNQWRMTAAAADLGIERSHLYKKMKTLGIERP